MGHSWIEVEISDLERKKSREVKALVSTGAGEIKVKRGKAWIKLKGKEDAFPVWISDFIDKVLLGVVVLESFGFDVDPATGTLKERPLLLY